MSAKKEFDTKLDEKETFDSGIVSGELSGPCDNEAGDSGVICDYTKVDEDTGGSDFTKLADCLANLKVSPDTPPLELLFRPDHEGDTQLHIASVHGCEKSVSTIIRVCPSKGCLDLTNDWGHTALHLAVMSGNPVVTRMLVIAGASLAVRDYVGETPLHKAAAGMGQECLKALLTPVPEHTDRKTKLSAVLDQRNYNGQCCVHLAASAGSLETMQTLVYYGADINAMENLAGWTPLHIAARRGDSRMVQLLRARGGGAAVRARDYAGRTPRRLARRTRAETMFAADSDSDSDSDDDAYDSESETLFEKLRDSLGKSINVA